MAQYEIDLRGEICPYPMTETRKKMEELSQGDRLVVLVDYPLAVDNVPRWAENAGHTVVEVVKTDSSEWKIVLEKAA